MEGWELHVKKPAVFAKIVDDLSAAPTDAAVSFVTLSTWVPLEVPLGLLSLLFLPTVVDLFQQIYVVLCISCIKVTFLNDLMGWQWALHVGLRRQFLYGVL